MACLARQAEHIQQALWKIVTFITRSLPLDKLTDILGVNVSDGHMCPGKEVRKLMRRLDTRELWDKATKMVVALTDLHKSEIPVKDIVWFLMRYLALSDDPLASGFFLGSIQAISSEWAAVLPTLATSVLPACDIPSSWQVQLAAKSEDKRSVIVHNFLKRNVAFGAGETLLLKEICYTGENFRYFRDDSLRSLNAAYFKAAREFHDAACRSGTTISGDFLFGDCSRVASQEVFLLHLFSNGRYTQAPLKILPDSKVGHAGGAVVAAASASAGVALPLVSPAAKKRRARAGHSMTYWHLLSYCHTLLFLLPFLSMGPWLGCTSIPGWVSQRVVDEQSQHLYFWDRDGKNAEWCLPKALRDGDLHKVRQLIFVCDEGSEGWSLFQFLANYVKARTIFLRDPLHRLSNLFTNASSSDPNTHCECISMHVARRERCMLVSDRLHTIVQEV